MVIIGFGLNFNPMLTVAFTRVCITGNTQARPHAAQHRCVPLPLFLQSAPVLIIVHHLFNQTLMMDF